MLQSRKHLPFLYNPSNFTKEELIENFVVRRREFELIFDLIKNDRMTSPPQHILIQGQRGSGKTTLLLRLYYEVMDDKKLNKWLVPVIFDEEQYGVSTLTEFWMHLGDYLEEASADFIGLTDVMNSQRTKKNCEETCFEIIQNNLTKNKKKLVLFFDNFGQMIDTFSRKENQRLREILLTSSEMRVVAASSITLEFTYDYSKPFYEFFKIFFLENLTSKEAINLLQKLGESYGKSDVDKIIQESPHRVEVMRRITDGVPRTMVLLFEMFIDNEEGDSFRDLEMVLDKITPLYKHRMDDLKPLQRKIINAIALNWDAITVKEIVKKTGIKSNNISSQLRYLEKNNIVARETTGTKNNLYRIQERFFNIWYLMRTGRKIHKNRVRFLVEFLELWCDSQDLLKLAHTLKRSMKEGNLYEKYALYMTEALSYTSLPLDEQHSLMQETKKYLEAKHSRLINELSQSDIDIINIISNLLENGNEVEALNKAADIKNKSYNKYFLIGSVYDIIFKNIIKAEKYYLIAVENGSSDSLNNLAILYQNEFKDFQNAEKFFLMAVDNKNSNAMNNLATLYYNEYKDFHKAEKFYIMAVENNDSNAMTNLAILYQNEFKDFQNAEKFFLMAVKNGNSTAMFNLALLYENEFKDIHKAEKFYLMAVDNGDLDATNNLAVLYENDFKDFQNAEKFYLMGVDNGNKDAIFNLALLYENEFKDIHKAEKFYLMAVDNSDSDAMNNLAILYQNEFKDIHKAEKFYLMAIDNKNIVAMNNIAILYENELNDFNNAEKFYHMAVDNDDSGALFYLVDMYKNKKKDKKSALEQIEKSVIGEKRVKSLLVKIIILLWNDEVETSSELFKKEILKIEILKDMVREISFVLLFFIAKKQYSFVYKLFEDNNFEFMEKFKPIYYALINFMGKDYIDELKKIGPELKETVTEIIEKINEIERDFA